MRLRSLLLLLGSSSLAAVACGPPPPPIDGVTVTTSSNTETTDDEIGEVSSDSTPGDGDPSGTAPGDGDPGDGDPGDCFDAPAECLRFVRCVTALIPDQGEVVEEQFGEGGACWCGTEDEAQACYETCINELEKAIDTNPTEPACHESSCSLDELDPSEPYGPVVDGQCPDFGPLPQLPMINPLGVPGSFCSPQCGDLSLQCPEHSQTSAQGTCLIAMGNLNYCVARCFVDPTLIGGNQCQCGATCQPQGSPDGEGNLRGICTFE